MYNLNVLIGQSLIGGDRVIEDNPIKKNGPPVHLGTISLLPIQCGLPVAANPY